MDFKSSGLSFGLKLFLLVLLIWFLFFLFGVVMRKLLKVERKKLFSHNHINEQHKKIDWTIRIVLIVAMIVGFIINTARFPETIFYLEVYFFLVILVFLTESVTAYMEWNYVENRNAYVFTLIQLAFTAIILLVVYATDAFGLFEF